MKLDFLGDKHEAIVAGNGAFKLDVESGYYVKESEYSDVQISDGTVTYIFTGNLREGKSKGIVEAGIAHLGNIGSRSKIVFKKQNSNKA